MRPVPPFLGNPSDGAVALMTSTGKPLKFVFFPLGFLLSHVGRLTRIAQVLRERGHEVVFAGEDPRHPRTKMYRPQEEGFRLVYAKEPDYRYAWDRFEKYGLVVTGWDALHFERWAPLDKILERQIEIIGEEKPDLVVGDATISVSTAAHITGIPAACVFNSYNGAFLSPWSIYTHIIYLWNSLHIARVRDRVYRKHGKKQVNALRLLRSIPLVSPDLPGLFETLKGWPYWTNVGPIYSEPTSELPPWYDELDDGTTNVYITMGSTGLLETFLQRVYPIFSQLPYRFVVTTCDQVSDATKAMAPTNFRVVKHAPGSKILEKCEAMIFHGGNGSMYQALAAGVPMIALPCHLEQIMGFRPVLRQGCGMQLSPRRFRAKALARALEEILTNPKYRDATRRYSSAVRETDGTVRAADIFEQTAREGRPANLR